MKMATQCKCLGAVVLMAQSCPGLCAASTVSFAGLCPAERVVLVTAAWLRLVDFAECRNAARGARDMQSQLSDSLCVAAKHAVEASPEA